MNPVIIAGAGMAGLAAAVRLRAAGLPTLLVDRNPLPGGKLNLVESGGYRFDTGPSLLTMPEVFDELFEAVGLTFRDELPIVRLHPYCRYFFADGSMFETSDSMEAMSRMLLSHSPADVDGFFSFLAKAARWYRISAESVIYGPALDWKNFGRSELDPISFFRMRPFQQLNKAIESLFSDEKIRRVARLLALYTGCSPYRAPAIFTLIPFLEFGLGRWYVKGGLYKIVERLIARYRELGGEFLAGTSVDEIVFEGGRAARARLSDGSIREGAHFVVNADVQTASSTFLSSAPGAAAMCKRLRRLTPSSSAFVMMIGARVRPSELIHHNILFSADEQKEWREVFDQGRPPEDPTIYLNHPSYSDSSLAPPGRAALFAMVNVPADRPEVWDWPAEGERYGERVLESIERRILPGLRGSIDELHRLTPPDFRERTYADRGSLYGSAPETLRAMLQRPRNREGGFEGVTFAGGTTHPGGGLPLAALSGKLAANLLLGERDSR